MSGYSVSVGANRIASGEYDEIFTPREPRHGCGVILVHGSGNPMGFTDTTAQPASTKLAAALTNHGIPCVAGDMGGQTWGNDTVISRITAAWGILKSQFPIRTDKMCLLGVSMGGAAVARYSQLNPSKVAAVVGLLPLWDLVAFYTANIGGTQAQVGTAWGVTAPAALPSGAAIAANASAAAGIPTLSGYSSVDTTVLPAWVTAYSTVVGGTTQIIDTVAGHSDAAIAGMPISTVLNFLLAHGA